MKYYYADESTKKLLQSKEKRVYLYGGFIGYNNFGDIIQLKHAIHYHKTRTNISPVVVIHLTSLESVSHLNDLKKWYQVENILLIADEMLDATHANVSVLKYITSGGLLHVYGGGYLNKYWGRGILEKIDDMITALGVSNYLFSGQQVERETIPFLNDLFKKKQPILFGARDKETYEWMTKESVAPNVQFSFDDVTEIFQAWKAAHQPSLKLKLINKLRPSTTLIHMNISSYATANKNGVLGKIRATKKHYPKNRVMLAHAYNDIRLSLRDTLQSVLQMENDFPYYEYKVVNIAQMALDIDPVAGKYPNIADIFSVTNLTLASSYHTAMLSMTFDVPAFLMSENEFYSQKRKALGLTDDFEAFLKTPLVNLNNFSEERAARTEWLDEMERVIKGCMNDVLQKRATLVKGEIKYKQKLVFRNPNS